MLHTGTDYRVYEAAVSFPTADTARAFVAASADKWKACAGSAVTVTATGGVGHWTFGDLTGAAPKITHPRTRKDGTNQCQRVLRAVSAIVLDLVACAPAIQDQAPRSPTTSSNSASDALSRT